MDLVFITSNRFKLEEVKNFFIKNISNYTIVPYFEKIEELQSDSIEKIVVDKATKAFKILGRPLIVEHTGLINDCELPGGLTQLFWDKLSNDDKKMGKLIGTNFGKIFKGQVKAVTYIAYCDGKKIITYKGECEGEILETPRGDSKFQWDVVFRPKNSKCTFAQNPEYKAEVSMRIQALEKLQEDLQNSKEIPKEQKYIDELKKLNQDKKTEIVLFVGAGVSVSAGLPTWGGLINNIANELNYDSDVFKTYGDYLTLAQYYNIEKNNDNIFKEKLRGLFEKCTYTSAVLSEIKKCDCKTIYTTNYDNLLEVTLKEEGYKVVTSDIHEDEFSKFEKKIIKFHGSCYDSKSEIVFGEASYFDRIMNPTDIDRLFASDIKKKNFLFIGYSFNDLNLRLILHSIENKRKGQHTNLNSYIFLSEPNPVQEQLLLSWNIKPIVAQNIDKSKALLEFLKEING